MAIFMQLRLAGDLVRGNVTETNHTDWIECQSLSWGMGLENRQAALPHISEVTITKYLDESSPVLFNKAVTRGTGTCKIHLTKAGEGAEVIMEYELENCVILKFSQNSDSEKRDESVSLGFGTITMSFTGFDERSRRRPSISASYSLDDGQRRR